MLSNKKCKFCDIKKESDGRKWTGLVCYDCRLEQEKIRYHKNKNARKNKRKEYYLKNQEYTINKSKEYYENNLEKVRDRVSNHYYNNKEEISVDRKLRKYNITEFEYNTLKAKTKGLCEICNKTPSKECIDHDHNTGLVRGISCNECNSGIGFLKDNINILQNAVKYLRRSECMNTEEENICVYYHGAKKGVLPT